tara:strand:- start:223 stop:486 length:264 start_codon:yes stop_codon:yes gene_type:complete
MKVYILTHDSKFKAIDLGRLDNPKLYDKIYYLQNIETKKAASQKYIENPANKKRKQEYNHNRSKYRRSDIGNLGVSYFDDRYNGYPR